MYSVYLYQPPAWAASAGALASGCVRLVAAHGMTLAETPSADVAIAPLLRRKLSYEAYAAPALGTLIFHPSLLPRHRGPDAIKWAVLAGEPFTGVSWFWCDEGLDAGDLCEQELVAIPAGITPRAFYDTHVVPAALRTLDRALAGIARGYPRRIPQPHDAATYESFYPRPADGRVHIDPQGPNVETLAVG